MHQPPMRHLHKRQNQARHLYRHRRRYQTLIIIIIMNFYIPVSNTRCHSIGHRASWRCNVGEAVSIPPSTKFNQQHAVYAMLGIHIIFIHSFVYVCHNYVVRCPGPRFRGCRLDGNFLLPGPAKAGAWQIYGSTARFASGRVDHKYRI